MYIYTYIYIYILKRICYKYLCSEVINWSPFDAPPLPPPPLTTPPPPPQLPLTWKPNPKLQRPRRANCHAHQSVCACPAKNFT